MPERIIELESYHAMLGCVVAGMGLALMPKRVLDAFPSGDQLSVHRLPPGQDRAQVALFWRKGARAEDRCFDRSPERRNAGRRGVRVVAKPGSRTR